MIISEVLGGLIFSIHAKLLATLMGLVKSLRTRCSLGDVFLTKFSRDLIFFYKNSDILVIKYEKTQPLKIAGKLLEKLQIIILASRVTIQIFLVFVEIWKILGNICSLEQLFYQKKSLGASVI